MTTIRCDAPDSKAPESGSPFPLHQDWSYFLTRRDSMIAAVIHVSEATDEMGCLRVVPGSHRLGRRDFRCWRSGGHGLMTVSEALAQSCDVFFYQVGQKLGVDLIAAAERKIEINEQKYPADRVRGSARKYTEY